MNIVIASNTTGVMPVFQWIYPSLRMLQPRNNVGVIPIFQWTHPQLWIL